MNTPILSIVVPVYNVEDYLSHAVESVLNQTFKDYELILVDDDSTDSSLKICDRYASVDNRIRVIHQEHQNAVIARLNGIKAAKGRLVAFLDSDDWVDKDLYEKLYQPFFEDSSIDISVSPHTQEVNFVNRPRLTACAPAQWRSNEALEYMLADKWFSWSLVSKIYEKSLFEGLYVSYADNAYGEDLEINWKVFQKAKKIAYLPIFGYHYVYRANSMMNHLQSPERLMLLERIGNIIGSIGKKDEKLKQTAAKTLCAKFSLWFVEYLRYCDEPSEKITAKYRRLFSDNIKCVEKILSEKEKQYCRMAMMSVESFKKMIADMNKKLAIMCRRACENHKVVFIYGAGRIAAEISDVMENENLEYFGFVTTYLSQDYYCNKPVMLFKEAFDNYAEKACFILALNERNKAEVEKNLAGINGVSYFNGGQYSIFY